MLDRSALARGWQACCWVRPRQVHRARVLARQAFLSPHPSCWQPVTDRELEVRREVIAAKAVGLSLGEALRDLTILELAPEMAKRFWEEASE